MLQGNIDLTENLDFYRDKKKKPYKNSSDWKPDDNVERLFKNNENLMQLYENYLNTSISYYDMSYNGFNSSSVYDLDYDMGSDIETTSDYNNYSMLSTSNHYVALSSSFIESVSNSNNWTYNSINNISTRSLCRYYKFADYNLMDEIINADSKLDCFGQNIKRPKRYKSTKDLGRKRRYTSISAKFDHKSTKIENTKVLFNKKERKQDDEFITKKSIFSIENENTHIRPRLVELYGGRRRHHRPSISDYDEEKIRLPIPWLQHLPDHIYDDYINDLYTESDYSKYLTDMNWLRITQ